MWDNNPYYNPENLGLTKIAEYEISEPSWSFDTIIVLHEEETGHIYAAHDSGCSCPTPFEDHKFPEDFTRITNVAELESVTESHSWRDTIFDREAYSNAKNKVREILRDNVDRY